MYWEALNQRYIFMTPLTTIVDAGRDSSEEGRRNEARDDE